MRSTDWMFYLFGGLAVGLFILLIALSTDADNQAHILRVERQALALAQQEYMKSGSLKSIRSAAQLRDEHYRQHLAVHFDPDSPGGEERDVVVLYVSPTCELCWRMWNDLKAQLPDVVKETKRPLELHLRFAPGLHETDIQWALYAECVARQGGDWLTRFSEVFRPEQAYAPDYIAQVSDALGLKMSAIESCLADPAVQDAIAGDLQQKVDYGHQYVPLMIVNGYRVVGYLGEKAGLLIKDFIEDKR